MRFEAVQRHRALACAAALAVFGSAFHALPARAADDNSSGNPLVSVLSFVGMQPDEEKHDIDYRARPPLVLPPNDKLPPPISAGAGRPATWPVDPTEVARRRAAADSRRPAPQINAGSGSSLNNGSGSLSKSELLEGRAGKPDPDTRTATSGCLAYSGTAGCDYTTWDRFKAKIGLGPNHENDVVAGEEPARDYLTEPPPGYRRPTANTTAAAVKFKVQEDPGDNRNYAREEAAKRKVSVDDDQ